MTSVILTSEQDAVRFAAAIAALARPGDVIALFGTLGMGKTVFSRAFIRALGNPNEEVPSPTFTLVQTYDAKKNGVPLCVWHFDLYRIKQPEEIYELGFEEALQDVSLIEWPENALPLLPKTRLEIHFDGGALPSERRLTLVPKGTRWETEKLPS